MLVVVAVVVALHSFVRFWAINYATRSLLSQEKSEKGVWNGEKGSKVAAGSGEEGAGGVSKSSGLVKLHHIVKYLTLLRVLQFGAGKLLRFRCVSHFHPLTRRVAICLCLPTWCQHFILHFSLNILLHKEKSSRWTWIKKNIYT